MARHRVPYERSLPVGVALAVALAAAAGAQESQSLTVDVGECVNLPSREERLACYERRVDAARRESARPAAAAARSAQAASPAAAPARSVESTSPAAAPVRSVPAGRAGPEAGRSNVARAGSTDAEAQTEEVIGTITALRETVPHAYLITLDNGQVWRQRTPENYLLREGQRVRIYAPKRRWGNSMRLTVENQNGFILVDRVH